MDFKLLKEQFPLETENLLLFQKGNYPYSYIDSFDKFKEVDLPHFGPNWINTLSGETNVNKKDVKTAKKFGVLSTVRTLATIMICIWSVIHYFLLTFLRNFVTCSKTCLILTHRFTSVLQTNHGMLCSKQPKQKSICSQISICFSSVEKQFAVVMTALARNDTWKPIILI